MSRVFRDSQFAAWLLLFAGILACSGSAQTITPATAGQRSRPGHRLRLYETHTKQRINIVFQRNGKYVPGAIEKLDWFLRDHRTGDMRPFNPRLFDLLYDLTKAVGRPDGEIDVICGYRTPWSNEYLRETTTGVARHSLHMQAMAIDIRMPGVPLVTLRNAALRLHRGGVGYYPRSQFVHVDVGRPRWW